jgi:UDP-N-acetylglucosamine--dolichyl-phosphate N-acetylglucosaminephosphotransferase
MTRDFHKKNKPLVPWSAGIPVLAGLMAGVLVFVFTQVFVYYDSSSVIELFAAMTTIMVAVFVGFLDDLNVREIKIRDYYYEGEQKKYVTGLSVRRWVKPLLTLPAAIPLMVINAGHSTAFLPWIGQVNLGFSYPLLIIPIGVLVGTNMVNMTGGYNGLEAGMGVVYTLALGIFALTHGATSAAVIFLSAFGALLAVLRFNFFPARILSGDSLQYLLGAVLVTGAIIGDMQKVTAFAILPLFVNAAYKVYLRFFKLRFFPGELGVLQRNGTIRSRYDKSYTIINFLLRRGRFTEKQLVLVMIGIEAVFCIISLLIFY